MRNLVPDKKGMDLSIFLLKYKSEMRNTRAFYVVEPKIDSREKNVAAKSNVKIGIAGAKYGDSWGRLKQYEITYGRNERRNDCRGVWIWYCGITQYDPLVLEKNCQVRKMETWLKRVYRNQNLIARGTERIKKTPQQVLKDVRAIAELNSMKDEIADQNRRDEVKKISKERKDKLKKQREDTLAEYRETYEELYRSSDAWLKEQQRLRKQENVPKPKQKIMFKYLMDDGTTKFYAGTVTSVTSQYVTIRWKAKKDGSDKIARRVFIKGQNWKDGWDK